MNRLRAKIDKEIENKDIKKKLRNVQARVHSNLLFNPNPTSFEKAGSLTAKSSTRRSAVSRPNNALIQSERRASPQSPRNHQAPAVQTTQRQTFLEDSSLYSKNSLSQQKQPLGMYMSSSFNQKSRNSNRQKKPKTKTSILPAISDNEPVEGVGKSNDSLKSMRNLFSSRNADSLSSSSSDVHSRPSTSRIPVRNIPQNKPKLTARSSARSRDCLPPCPSGMTDMISLSSGSSTYLNLDLDLCSLSSPKSSDDVYHMAPLIPAPSTMVTTTCRTHLDTSAVLIRKFRNVLAREELTMPDDEIKVVKDVLKTDERVNLLKAQESDSNLFKDILKTQLNEIVKSEKVVKNALRMLGSSPQLTEIPSKVVDLPLPATAYHVTPIPKRPSNSRKYFSPRIRVKGKHHHYSTDSSPRCHLSIESEDYLSGSGGHRNVATDTLSMKDSTPRNEVFSNTEKKSLKSMKSGKLITANVTSNDEFEAFVKNTLPFKRSSISPKRPAGQKTLRRQKTFNDTSFLKMVKGTSIEYDGHLRAKDSRRPQVDVTFKNVPSVEKEILILKALGKRLEETIKRSVSEPSLFESEEKGGLPACSSTSSLTRELKKIDPSIKVYPGRRTADATPVRPLQIAMNIVPWITSCVGFLIFSKGVRLELGIVNEFVIVSKSVNELLSERAGNYFIANENEPGGLEPIPFRRVVEQPQVLMQYLKPKNSAMPFNLLDQDSIFFNSFLLPGLKSKVAPRYEKIDACVSTMIEAPVKEIKPTICEGGDSLLVAVDALHSINEVPSSSKHSVEKVAPPRRLHSKKSSKVKHHTMEQPVSATPSQRVVHRARMRRVVTPMPNDAFDDPKNNLVKTILVGAVQVSIFLVMIMAITYPDIKC